MSGRLEEMPGEEGYPAYLGSRLAEFYERAGNVICLGQMKEKGSNCYRCSFSTRWRLIRTSYSSYIKNSKVFWGLDSQLAYRRHFPAINWLNSYSLYIEVGNLG